MLLFILMKRGCQIINVSLLCVYRKEDIDSPYKIIYIYIHIYTHIYIYIYIYKRIIYIYIYIIHNYI